MTEELNNFSHFIGLESIASARYTSLFLFELFHSSKSDILNPQNVMCEIKALEGIGKPTGLKPPSAFKHPPLKGLWHKHYREDGIAPLAFNLKKALKKYGMALYDKKINQVQESGEESYFFDEDIELIINDGVYNNHTQLIDEQAVTGEWIIYAQNNGVNYYLCLGNHNSGDNNLREKIDALCCPEFPFLTDILAKI